MEVVVGNKTPNVEETIFRAARGDYYSGFVWEESVETLLEGTSNEVETIEDFLHKRMDHEEWGVFEHGIITFGLKGISREVLAHIARHRHLTLDVQSMRYVDFSDAEYTIPEVLVNDNYANRHGEVDISNEEREEAMEKYTAIIEESIEQYRELVDIGMPVEDARKVLPIATEVNITLSGNPRALMHVLNLRMKFNAQNETRELADMMYAELEDWIPSVCSWYDAHGPLKTSP